MELGNNLEKLKEYLLSKGFVIDEFRVYNYKNYEFYMVISKTYIDFNLSKYSKIEGYDEEEFILTFCNEFNSRDLAKLKTIISTIINN